MLDDKRAESFVLSFKDGIAVLEQPDGGTVLQSPDAEITWAAHRRVSGPLCACFPPTARRRNNSWIWYPTLAVVKATRQRCPITCGTLPNMVCCVTRSHGTEADWLRSSRLRQPGTKYPTNRLPKRVLRSRDLSTFAKMPANSSSNRRWRMPKLCFMIRE